MSACLPPPSTKFVTSIRTSARGHPSQRRCSRVRGTDADSADKRGSASKQTTLVSDEQVSHQEKDTPPNTQPNQGWLEGQVQLPGGYRTTRRDVLKLFPLLGGIGCFYVAADNVKAFQYASPRALLNALLPQAAPLSGSGGDVAPGSSERVTAFVRFIADLEKRGGGQVVPDFPRGLDWLNAPPLSLQRELSGKLVVLDFWTYCCINCMHVLPELAAVEKVFDGQPVAVVGVHSAKFDNEKDSDAIRNAVLRYDVRHAVVNDGGMELWGALGVASWPTLAVVSPRGRLLAMLSGEGHQQDLTDLLQAGLQYYGPLGLLKDAPVPMALERDKGAAASSSLRYPGKLTTDLAGGRLFISDSNNHRIVITTLDGAFIDQVGGNGAALRDGDFAAASFNRPQGVAFDTSRQLLYVADTENHALRCVDLANRRITTLVGNGTKGGDYRGGGRGSEQALNSPWDVTLLPGQPQSVYVALAGQHQLWRYDVSTGAAEVFSGTGSERNQNGATGSTTAWAQPSGLTPSADEQHLYVADSESSSVRVVDVTTGGGQLLAGGDRLLADNLFRFGDRDGQGSAVLMQHPLAVLAVAGGGTAGETSEQVYVADSYNHRIKVVDPASGSVTTVAGSGRPSFADGVGTSAALSEPGGLALGPDGTLLIADTNNSLIRVLDLATSSLTTLTLTDVPPPRVSPFLAASASGPSGSSVGSLTQPPPGHKLIVSQETLAAAGGSVEIQIWLPPGYHLTKGANSGFTAQVIGGDPAVLASASVTPARGLLPDTASPSFTVQYKRDNVSPAAVTTAAAGKRGSSSRAAVRVLVKVYFCQEEQSCLFEQLCFDVPLTVGGGAAGGGVSSVRLKREVSAAAPIVTLP